MKTFFASAIALSLMTTAAMAANQNFGNHNRSNVQQQNQQHSQQNNQRSRQERQKQTQAHVKSRAQAKSDAKPQARQHVKRTKVEKTVVTRKVINNRGDHRQYVNKKITNKKVKAERRARHARGEYRYNGRNFKAMQGPSWHAPKGYRASQKWRRGQNLPNAYRNRAYVVDHHRHNLNRPAAGYQWVRVNNNVYLVQARNGMIAQIVWSVFR